MARARRGRTPLHLALLDVDHFKRFNDTHGHPAGGLLLQSAAANWRAQLRDGDMLARYGGEEFAAVVATPAPPPAGDRSPSPTATPRRARGG
jgi:diguanylate cyclase (GGDEF)-like protein